MVSPLEMEAKGWGKKSTMTKLIEKAQLVNR